MIHGSAYIEQARDGEYLELPATAGLAKQPPRDFGHSCEPITQMCRSIINELLFFDNSGHFWQFC